MQLLFEDRFKVAFFHVIYLTFILAHFALGLNYLSRLF